MEEAFKSSVEEYLGQCLSEGIEPQKPFLGKFNLRLPLELHMLTAQAATRQGKSVNQYIVDAIQKAVGE